MDGLGGKGWERMEAASLGIHWGREYGSRRGNLVYLRRGIG